MSSYHTDARRADRSAARECADVTGAEKGVDNPLPVGLKFNKCLDERVKPRGNWPKRLGFGRFGTLTRGLDFSRY